MTRNRGNPKPKLRDLTRVPPTKEESEKMIDAFSRASPIARAIIGAVMVEHELDELLRKKFRNREKETWSELTSDNGPIGTFHQKIIIGHAFGIYDERTRGNLHIVRSIRNAFAHSKTLIGFDHDLVLDELKKIDIPDRRYSRFFKTPSADGINAYSSLCMTLVIQLTQKRVGALQKQVRALKITATMRKKAKAAKLSPYANSLLPFLHPYPRGAPGYDQLAFQGAQSGDPNFATLLGSPLALLETLPTDEGKKDK